MSFLQIQRKDSECGRSMLEMIGVLALIGLLSVIMIPAMKYAMNKTKANNIIHDGRIVQMESMSRQGEVALGWQAPQYKSGTGHEYWMMRDIKENDFVKVDGIEHDVCVQLRSMQSEKMLTFLTESFQPMTECQETNKMVMAFDGLGEPAECLTENDCQEAHAIGWYCDQTGHCIECDPELSDVNGPGNGCACKEHLGAHSCSDNEGHTWCCGRWFECGTSLKECIDAPPECETADDCEEKGKNNHYCNNRGRCVECEGLTILNDTKTACVCNASQAVTCTGEKDGQPYTWCCSTDEEGNGQICGAESDQCMISDGKCWYNFTQKTEPKPLCHYTLSQTTEAKPLCHYTISEDESIGEGSVTQITGCPTGQYCYLLFSNTSCNTASSTATDLYGLCYSKSATTFDFTCSTNTLTSFEKKQGCPTGQYCYLLFSNTSCNSASATATDLYGLCYPKETTVFDFNCSTHEITDFEKEQGCPADQYCSIKWRENSCSALGNNYNGTLYGACIPKDQNTPACPY